MNRIKYFKKAEYLFVILAVIFGVTLIKIIPPLWGTDETAHFGRSYQIAHGEFSPPRDSNGAYGGELPKNLIALWSYTKNDLMDNKVTGILSRKDVDNNNAYQQLVNQPFSKDQETSPGSAIYSPAAYIAPICGVIIAGIFHASIGKTIFLARLSSLVLYVAIVWLAIRLLRNSKLKWLIFIAGLIPTSIYQASVVTADTMAIGLSLLFAALFIRLVQHKSQEQRLDKQLFCALVLVSIAMAMVKINYVFLGLAILVVPNKIFSSTKNALAAKIGGVSLMAILGEVAAKMAKATSNMSISQRPDGARVVPSDQITLVMHHPLYFVAACVRSLIDRGDFYYNSMMGLIGWNYVAIPTVFIMLLTLGLLLAAVYGHDELIAMRRKIIVLNTFVLGGIASTFGALYITFTPVGSGLVDGIQGRYFLPFLVPVAMLIGSLMPFEVKIKKSLAPYIFGSISSICLLVSVAYYYFITY